MPSTPDIRLAAELHGEALAMQQRLAAIRIAFAGLLLTAGTIGIYDLDPRGFWSVPSLVTRAVTLVYLAGAVVAYRALRRRAAQGKDLCNIVSVQAQLAFVDTAILTVASLQPMTLLAERGVTLPQALIALVLIVPCLLHSLQLNLERSRILGATFAAAGLAVHFLVVPHNLPPSLTAGAVAPFAIAVAMYLFIFAFGHVNAQRVRELIRKSASREIWRDRMARFIPPEAIAAIEREGGIRLGGRRHDAAILFTDLRGYTQRAETQTPEEVLSFLNGYLKHMVEAVFAHGGTLDKFIGDAVLAVFSDRDGAPGCVAAALACAVDMQARMTSFNDDLAGREDIQVQYREPVQMVAAVHFGPVIAGWIGSEERPEFTVIGDTVNVAARLEGLAKALDQPIVVSEDAVSRLASPPSDLVDLGAHELKGRSRPLKVFGMGGGQVAMVSSSRTSVSASSKS